jgi:shikimate dehydrogenase
MAAGLKRFAVVGSPIAHSLSPQIHQAFAQQFGHSIQYEKIDPESQGFTAVVNNLLQNHFTGINVTLPFKAEALKIADTADAAAVSAGAANTLTFDCQQRVAAYNTDGAGLMMDLKRLQFPVHNQRICVIGAGGATRGILPVLLAQNPHHVYIANRSLDRAAQLAKPHSNVTAVRIEDVFTNVAADGWIQSTAAARGGRIDWPTPTHKPRFVYDLNYGEAFSTFRAWCQHCDLPQPVDGLGMLVAQAAMAYQIWHGKLPEIKPILNMLRQSA